MRLSSHLGVQLRLEGQVLGCNALQALKQVTLLLRERELVLLDQLRAEKTLVMTALRARDTYTCASMSQALSCLVGTGSEGVACIRSSLLSVQQLAQKPPDIISPRQHRVSQGMLSVRQACLEALLHRLPLLLQEAHAHERPRHGGRRRAVPPHHHGRAAAVRVLVGIG